jgi:hypothetical protein
MIPFSDPERPALQLLAQHRVEQAWRRGVIGDATLVRSLVFDGVPPDEAASRLRMLKMDGKPDAETARDEASRKWMEKCRG